MNLTERYKMRLKQRSALQFKVMNLAREWIYLNRSYLKLFLDVSLWSSMTLVAYLLRFDGEIAAWRYIMESSILILLGVKALAILLSGTHHHSWSNVSFNDLFRILYMLISVTVLYVAGALIFRERFSIPLSIPLLEFALSLTVLSSLRVFTRYAIVYKRWNIDGRGGRVSSYPDSMRRVVVVGAGSAGTMTVREMLRNPQAGYLPIAFLDDDPTKLGQKIMGVSVFGEISSLPALARKRDIDELIIAMPSQTGDVIRSIVTLAEKVGIQSRTMPGLYDLISGNVSIEQIRTVQVEDLLRRKPVQLDNEAIAKYITGRTVLVTGAGGSIGSELVLQVLQHSPEKIVLVGRGENSIHEIHQKVKFELSNAQKKLFKMGEKSLSAIHSAGSTSTVTKKNNDLLEANKSHSVEVTYHICDVRDRISLEAVFAAERPQVVFHAAAHKHVYLMEKSPEQAIYNNVIGTQNMVQLCIDYGVRRLVNISSDKAVNPTSVMGASKRLSEQVVLRGSFSANEGQIFTSVRFGNVLGSRGSVVPIFKEQIRNGGPITVTHPDMVRYFMTIPEASQLVLQAGAIAKNGLIYVLDMGKPVRIVDMARDLIRLSGLEPDKDIKIEFTGVKQGEKMYEELLTAEEGTTMSQHEKIFVAGSNDLSSKSLDAFDENLEELVSLAVNGGSKSIRAKIREMLPTYQWNEPAEAVKKFRREQA